MDQEDDFERVYTGSEVNVLHLQSVLQEKEIPTIVRNEFQSGLRGGFGGGLPGQVQLFVPASHLDTAHEIAKDIFPEE